MAQNYNSIRNDFILNPDVIYFNHGSFGATPRPVFESYQRWQKELECQPTEFFGRKAPSLLNQAREVLAGYLGTASQNIAFVTNATTGLNIVAKSLQLQPGDEVLTTNHEYGALDRTWQYNAVKQGYKYINHSIPLPVTTPQEFIEQLWKGVTDRTRVIYLSHITSPTALIFPIHEIIEKAHQNHILTVIDGAHAPGQVLINLDELGADFYTGNLHKWLCAPKGAGFVYARPEFHHLIEPVIVSWGYQSQNPGPSQLVDYVETQGTRDLSAFLAVPDAIKYFQYNDWSTRREECHRLLVETMEKISVVTGLEPISPLTHQWISQMASIPIPDDLDCAEVHRRLYDDYRIEIPVLEWNSIKLVRISMQAYNTIEDAYTLVNALQRIIAQ